MKKRSDYSKLPLNVYELHFGSFRKPSEEPDAWYDYEEMADILLPYLKENGYNYLEIMPLNEYPCDESWGYQETGFSAPTSRYGTADQLKYFVDRCHENDIGVILDFVPVHFAVDAMHWQIMTGRRCMSIRILMWETVSGGVGTLCTPAER